MVSSQSDRRTSRTSTPTRSPNDSARRRSKDPEHDDPGAGQRRHVGHCTEQSVRRRSGSEQESFALLQDRIGEFVPAESTWSGGQHRVASHDRAHVEPGRLAEAAHEELEWLGLPRADQPEQRRPTREQPGGGQRVLAVLADLVARGHARQLHLGERLLLGLLAQQPGPADGEREDGDQQQSADRERERSSE